MNEVRVELGFVGGGGVTATVDNAEWEQLKAALEQGEGGWLDVPEKDGDRILVASDKVVYARVRVLTRAVGFAGA